MKDFSWGGLIVAVLGLLIMASPAYFFPGCETMISTAAGGSAPMKCFWTGRAALGGGGMIAVSGFLLLLAKHPGVRLGLAFLPLCAGLLVILTSNLLIGVCPGAMMPCRMGTLPALSFFGFLAVLASGCIVVSAGRRMAALGGAIRRAGEKSGPYGEKGAENGERA